MPGGAADVLAVDGDGLGARCVLRGPGARGAVERVGVQRGEDLDERGRGRGGEAPQAMAVKRPQGAKLALGQSLGELADRGGAVVPGELRGHRDGQDGGERVTPPARATELRHGAKTLPQASKPSRGPRSRVAFASPLGPVVEAAQLLARVCGPADRRGPPSDGRGGPRWRACRACGQSRGFVPAPASSPRGSTRR